jgi:hypothetical protein
VQLILDRIQSWITDRLCLVPFKEKELPRNGNQTKWESAELSERKDRAKLGQRVPLLVNAEKEAVHHQYVEHHPVGEVNGQGAIIISSIP